MKKGLKKKTVAKAKSISLGLLAVCCSLLAHSQDINFSQFYELPLLRNPALAGLFTGDIRATAVWRNQWNSITVPYKTQGLGVEVKFPVRGMYWAGGLQITNDKAGDSKLGRLSAAGTLTAHIPVSNERESFVSAGFTVGSVWQRFSEEQLRWNAQFINGAYDPTAPTGQNFGAGFPTTKSYSDLSAGLLFSSVFANEIKYYVGAAGFHVATSPRTFTKAGDSSILKMTVNGGMSIPSSDFDRIILYTDVFWQGGARQVQGGLLYKHDILQDGDDYGISLSGGVFTRWADAVMPLVKLDYYKLGVGITYDANLSKLSKASGGRGGFEVTATFRSDLNIRNGEAAAVRCPSF